jgi:hypothetical protein
LVALREGALIAQCFGAEAHLLIIDPDLAIVSMAEGYSGLLLEARGQELLDLGLSRLKQLGVIATGELLRGDAKQLIVDRVKRQDRFGRPGTPATIVPEPVVVRRKRRLYRRWHFVQPARGAGHNHR